MLETCVGVPDRRALGILTWPLRAMCPKRAAAVASLALWERGYTVVTGNLRSVAIASYLGNRVTLAGAFTRIGKASIQSFGFDAEDGRYAGAARVTMTLSAGVESPRSSQLPNCQLHLTKLT